MTRQPWKHLLNVADIWNADDMAFCPTSKEARQIGPPYNRRDLIVARIKMLDQYIDDHGHPDFDEDLWWIVDEMSDVLTEDDFDVVWSGFYDWADVHRVWVELWNPNSTSILRAVPA